MNATRPNTKEGYQLFHDASIALSTIEAHGIKIDLDYLDSTIDRLKKRVRQKEESIKSSKVWRKWQRRFGEKANLTSVQQLGTILKQFGVELEENEETGNLKVDKVALAKTDMKFTRDLVTLREDKKVLDTYLRGIRREVGDDGCLHPSYNLASGEEDKKGGASSFRGSCSDPNFQNIPIRNPEMRDVIRPCFTARKGRRIVERDFSGIEFRIFGCYTKDKTIIRYVSDPTTDVHRDTAMDLFFLKQEQVDKKTHRDAAKNMFVFPQLFGSVYFLCAPAIWEAMIKRKFMVDGKSIFKHLAKHGITELGDCTTDAKPKKGTFVEHVRNVERILWEKRFKRATQWRKEWYSLYLRRGWIPMKTGFVCQGYYRRNQVLNFAIQGSAFHCMLKVIVEMMRRIRKDKMKTLIVGQIHDSLLADVPDNEVQYYCDMTHDVMSKWLPVEWPWLIVPIDTEVEITPIGGNWNQKTTWVNKTGDWEPE